MMPTALNPQPLPHCFAGSAHHTSVQHPPNRIPPCYETSNLPAPRTRHLLRHSSSQAVNLPKVLPVTANPTAATEQNPLKTAHHVAV